MKNTSRVHIIFLNVFKSCKNKINVMRGASVKKLNKTYWAIALIAVLAVAVFLLYGQIPTEVPTTTTTVPATTTVPTTVATTVPATTTAAVLAKCSDTCVSMNYTTGNCRVSCYGWETKVEATCDIEGQKCCCKK